MNLSVALSKPYRHHPDSLLHIRKKHLRFGCKCLNFREF